MKAISSTVRHKSTGLLTRQIAFSCLLVRSGSSRYKLRKDDFMVVAPYNAPVRRLGVGLPTRVRVETVDKLQGQQAQIDFLDDL